MNIEVTLEELDRLAATIYLSRISLQCAKEGFDLACLGTNKTYPKSLTSGLPAVKDLLTSLEDNKLISIFGRNQ